MTIMFLKVSLVYWLIWRVVGRATWQKDHCMNEPSQHWMNDITKEYVAIVITNSDTEFGEYIRRFALNNDILFDCLNATGNITSDYFNVTGNSTSDRLYNTIDRKYTDFYNTIDRKYTDFVAFDLSCESTSVDEIFLDVFLNKTSRNFTITSFLVNLDRENLEKLKALTSAYNIVVTRFADDTRGFESLFFIKQLDWYVPQLFVTFLVRFDISYVVILYEDNLNGRTEKDRLIYLFKDNKICLAQIFVLTVKSNLTNIVSFLQTREFINFIIVVTEDVYTQKNLLKETGNKLLGRTWLFYNYVDDYMKDLPYYNKLSILSTNLLKDAFAAERDCEAISFIYKSYSDAITFSRKECHEFHGRTMSKNCFENFKSQLNTYQNRNKLKITFIHVELNLLRETNITMLGIYSLRYNSPSHTLFFPHTYDTVSKLITKRCNIDCTSGYFPIPYDGSDCCWTCHKCEQQYFKNTTGNKLCEKCPPNSISDTSGTYCIYYTTFQSMIKGTSVAVTIIIVSIGSLLCCCFIIVFVKFATTPVVKSSNFKLSLLQLFLHLSMNLILLLYLMEQTNILCIINFAAFGLIFSLIIAIYLSKTYELLLIFNATNVLPSYVVYKKFWIVLVVWLANVILTIILSIFIPRTFFEERNILEVTRIYICQNGIQFYIEIIYLFLLSILCAIQAFKARKLPSNYNESSFIAVAMFSFSFLLFMMIIVHASLKYTEHVYFGNVAMICSINMLTMLLTYGYKIIIILFYPKKNTKKYFQEQTFKEIQKEAKIKN